MANIPTYGPDQGLPPGYGPPPPPTFPSVVSSFIGGQNSTPLETPLVQANHTAPISDANSSVSSVNLTSPGNFFSSSSPAEPRLGTSSDVNASDSDDQDEEPLESSPSTLGTRFQGFRKSIKPTKANPIHGFVMGVKRGNKDMGTEPSFYKYELLTIFGRAHNFANETAGNPLEKWR